MLGRRGGEGLVETPEMVFFFDRLDRLNLAQLLVMRATWMSIDLPAHEDAWSAVRAAGARYGLADEIERVRKKALAWSTRGSNSIPYQTNADYDWLQVKVEAGEAIVDAALAVALGNRLDEATHDVLIEPWLRATQPA